MEEIETKTQIQSDISQLKREYKSLSVSISTLKVEHDSLVSINDRQRIIKSQLDEDIKSIINQIADAKLQWAHEREAQEVEISEKIKEIADIIARKSELDIQEQKNLQILEDDKKVLNENRVLMLELEDKAVEIESKKRELEVIESSIEAKRKLLEDEVTDFKNKINRVVKEINK